MSILSFDKDSFYIDGKPFRIIAGDIHYFRIHQSNWERVLDLAVDFAQRRLVMAVQLIVAIAVGHIVAGVLVLDIFIGGAGQEGGKIGIIFHCDAHAVGHFVAHHIGQRHHGNLGIHRRLAGNGHGNAADAHGGVHPRPGQPLYRKR